MKATLTFNLPEEVCEFWDHANGPKYRDACTEVDRWCRDQLKYQRLSNKTRDALLTIRNILREELDSTDWEGA